MVDYVIQSVRSEPYPTDRLIMRSLGRFVPLWVTPNQITWLRFLGIPGMTYLFMDGSYAFGLVVFLVLAFSDALDGAVARTRKQITPWGIMYDPVADKLLIGSAVAILATNRLGLALAFTVIGLEVVTILGGLYFKFFKKMLMPANLWGKSKMCLQVLAITLLLLDALYPGQGFSVMAFWVFMVASGCAFVSLFYHGA